jgi:hypothetical protein
MTNEKCEMRYEKFFICHFTFFFVIANDHSARPGPIPADAPADCSFLMHRAVLRETHH